MSIGFGYPTEDDICYLDSSEFWSSNSARYYVSGKHKYDEPTENGRGGCSAADISKAFTVVLICTGSTLAATAIGALIQSVTSKKGAWYKDFNSANALSKLQKQTNQMMKNGEYGWLYFKNRLRIFASAAWVTAAAIFVFWTTVGVLWGTLGNQRMTFFTALYFSVSSISTAGLESVKPLGKSTDTPQGALVDLLGVDAGL